jgi:hypothetical protein
MTTEMTALELYLRGELAPYGWSVETGAGTGGRTKVMVEHVLTGPFTLLFDPGEDLTPDGDLVQRFLNLREFELVRDRPAEFPHAGLVGKLRELALGMGLDANTVVALANVLQEFDVLTWQEADWLRSAGPSSWDE